MSTTFENRSGADPSTHGLQLDIFIRSARSPAANTLQPPEARRVADSSGGRKRVRPAELSFPPLEDTQLSFLAYPATNTETWSATEIAQFHENMVRDALRSLADGRASAEMRRRVIAWVARPLVDSRRLFGIPLSFQASCYACGLDAEVLQERVLRLFAPEELKALGYDS